MKKKLLTLAMSMAMVMCFTVGSFADTTESNGTGTALNTLVEFKATDSHSNYQVTVPEKLIIKDSTEYTSGADKKPVSVSGYCTKDVTVGAEKNITMTSSDDQETLQADVTYAGTTMAATTTVSGNEESDISVAWNSTAPAIDSWDGTIGYTVSLE